MLSPLHHHRERVGVVRRRRDVSVGEFNRVGEIFFDQEPHHTLCRAGRQLKYTHMLRRQVKVALVPLLVFLACTALAVLNRRAGGEAEVAADPGATRGHGWR